MISQGQFSTNLTCDREGNWQPDPYTIECTRKDFGRMNLIALSDGRVVEVAMVCSWKLI